jgi:P-loop containing NTP hydrolase pore-1
MSVFSRISRHLCLSAGEKSRLQQIVRWFGADYDGVIVFDEVQLNADGHVHCHLVPVTSRMH